MSDPLPAGPAWYGWRDRSGTHRLGVVDLRDATPRHLDLGPMDPMAELSAGRLTAEHLAELCANDPSGGMPAPDSAGAGTSYAAPIPRPGKILCLGKNFAAHAAEFANGPEKGQVPEEPIVFTKLPGVLTHHGADVVLPQWVESRIDHEVELLAVLGFADPEGTGARYVPPAQGLALVAGYTIINDVTARKMQGDDRRKQWPWLRCKSFDTFGPVGPWVVPAATFGAPAGKRISLTVDGETRQSSDLGKMVVSVGDAIAFLSKHFALHPGDLIAMGTPEGVGPIEHGHTVRCTIDGIGTLEHGVVREGWDSSAS